MTKKTFFLTFFMASIFGLMFVFVPRFAVYAQTNLDQLFLIEKKTSQEETEEEGEEEMDWDEKEGDDVDWEDEEDEEEEMDEDEKDDFDENDSEDEDLDKEEDDEMWSKDEEEEEKAKEEDKMKEKEKEKEKSKEEKGNDDGKSEDTKDEKSELTQEVVEERLGIFLEHIAELRIKLAGLTDTTKVADIEQILDVVETKLVSLKGDVAEMEAGDSEALAAADKAISAIKAKFKKAESQLEEWEGEGEEMKEELEEEDFTELVDKVTKELAGLAETMEEAQGKLIKKEKKGFNPLDFQAMIDEIRVSFVSIQTALKEAQTAEAEGDMITASKSIYAAFSELRIALSLADKLNFGQLKQKDPDEEEEGEDEEMAVYDELTWKAKYFLEKIGELRHAALALNNKFSILAKLTKAETEVMNIYTVILAVGPNGVEDELEELDDRLERIKRHFKKAEQFIKTGQEQDDSDVLVGEEAEAAANELMERMTKRYNKFVKRYNEIESDLGEEALETLEDLKEEMEENFDTAQAYLDQGNFENAQKYGYATLLGAKTGISLAKGIK